MNGVELGESMASAVDAAAPSIVKVAARCGRGSGVVWSEDLVVTAAHLVAGSREARVRLHDGAERAAKVLGGDSGSDVAVLRVEGGGLVPLAFVEDPASVRVGHLALALARPGRGIRASMRIVGVIGRDVPTRFGSLLPLWIETDRGLPEGFSGGATVDARGRAIGLSTDGLVRGADLAIPRDVIARVVDEVLAHGRVRRGWLGVALTTARLPSAIAAQVGRDVGALVSAIEEDGPAARGGLSIGDALVEIDGARVRGPEDVATILATRVDADVALRIVRASAVSTLTVRTGVRPS